MTIACATCGKALRVGEVMVTITMVEEVLHEHGEVEPVSILLSSTYCQPCGWKRFNLQRSALKHDLRAVVAQGYAKH